MRLNRLAKVSSRTASATGHTSAYLITQIDPAAPRVDEAVKDPEGGVEHDGEDDREADERQRAQEVVLAEGWSGRAIVSPAAVLRGR